MLIVIMIITVLIAIAVPAVSAYRRDALRTQDEAAVETIITALESALVRMDPGNTVVDAARPTNFAHFSGNLDYDTLVNPPATITDRDTIEFYQLLADYLGPNFQGNFKFAYNKNYLNDPDLPKGIAWVSYWRSDSLTSDDAVMFYYGNTWWEEFLEPLYLSEALEDAKYYIAEGIGSYTNFENKMGQYRP